MNHPIKRRSNIAKPAKKGQPATNKPRHITNVKGAKAFATADLLTH